MRAGSVVIVGIGINCRAQPRLGARLGRGVAALDEVLQRPVSRNAVIGAVAREVLGALAAWERAQDDQQRARHWSAQHDPRHRRRQFAREMGLV